MEESLSIHAGMGLKGWSRKSNSKHFILVAIITAIAILAYFLK